MDAMEQLLQKIYHARKGRERSRERPHKPALLVASLALIDQGLATPDRIPWGKELRASFRSIMGHVKSGNDSDNQRDPYLRLRGDGFWQVFQNGQELGPNELPTQIQQTFARFSPEYSHLLTSPKIRAQVRAAIISRFFPDAAPNLIRYLGDEPVTMLIREDTAEFAARSRAFAETVRQIYDRRCSACGMRIDVGGVDFVDAAHIKPWADSHDDRPANGLALCKNHHWAMDRHLIAPHPDLYWCVSSQLDERIADHKPLLELNQKNVIGPNERTFEPRFRPDRTACEWRMAQLLA